MISYVQSNPGYHGCEIVGEVSDEKMMIKLYGDTTRELYNVWHNRLGPSQTSLPQPDQIQSIFNDIGLFPSTSQVFEMLHCARECNSRPGTTSENHITFGEFCLFATEMRRYYNNHEKDPTTVFSQPMQVSRIPDKCRRGELRSQKSTSSAYDTFLGGSCNPTSWRQDKAIPHLKVQGITFYNPQQDNWVPEMIELEYQAKVTSQILFYVLNEQTRNIGSMIEVCQYAGNNRRLIVVLSSYPGPGHTINGEKLTKNEYDDLQAGMEMVQDLIERQGIPVFNNINVALNCTTKVIKENLNIEELGLKDQAQPVRLAHIQIGDKLVRLREAFDTLDTAKCGKLSLQEIKMAFRIHVHRDLSSHDLQAICSSHGVNVALPDLPLDQIFITFDEFCCLVSEYKTRLTRDQAKDSLISKTMHFISSAVLSPLTRASNWLSQLVGPGTRPRTYSSSHMGRRGSSVRDVYLGGSLGSSWREQITIPCLKKAGLTFYNPAICSSTRLIPIEAAAMDNSRVLLFVILSGCRSVSAMCQAAYLIGSGCNVVLCVQQMPGDAVVDGEKVTKLAVKDYNRGRSYLSDFANREGVPVFDEVQEAIECVIQKCKTSK